MPEFNSFLILVPISDGLGTSALWIVQLQLLGLAENSLGLRDSSKTIYQPAFADDGPYIRNTPNLDGAFAELSRNAETYWPTVVYELAHETVHLLNPKPGVGNWLSEGIAVAFSNFALRRFNLEPHSTDMQSYRRALSLVSGLAYDPLVAGRCIRAACGSLNTADQSILGNLFPGVDSEILTELCKPFVRN